MLHEFHKNFPAQEETCKCMVRENYLEIIISAVSKGIERGKRINRYGLAKAEVFMGRGFTSGGQESSGSVFSAVVCQIKRYVESLLYRSIAER